MGKYIFITAVLFAFYYSVLIVMLAYFLKSLNILLDEIHHAVDWSTEVKLLVDGALPLRIIATGSAPARIPGDAAQPGG